MDSEQPNAVPVGGEGGLFLVVCVRNEQQGTAVNGPGGYRWLRREAKRRQGTLLLRSPSRSIFIWPGTNAAGLQFSQAVLRAAPHCATGVAFGELGPTHKTDGPSVWGRAAVVATRLSEATLAGKGLVESNLASQMTLLSVGEETQVVVGKEAVSARETPAESAPISVRRDQLRQWISRVEHLPDKADLVLRLDALARLAEGQSGEALSSLRGAALAAQDPNGQCRASLAYAIALSAVGRSFEAMLEAMHALGSAREALDGRGEQACILFLGELARTSGQLEARQILETMPPGSGAH